MVQTNFTISLWASNLLNSKQRPLGLTLSSTRTLLIYVPNEEKYDPRPTDGWGDGFRIPSVEATLIGQTLSNSFINSISRNRLKTIQLNTSYVHYTINIWNTSKIPIANIESSYQPNSRSIMANNEKKKHLRYTHNFSSWRPLTVRMCVWCPLTHTHNAPFLYYPCPVFHTAIHIRDLSFWWSTSQIDPIDRLYCYIPNKSNIIYI